MRILNFLQLFQSFFISFIWLGVLAVLPFFHPTWTTILLSTLSIAVLASSYLIPVKEWLVILKLIKRLPDVKILKLNKFKFDKFILICFCKRPGSRKLGQLWYEIFCFSCNLSEEQRNKILSDGWDGQVGYMYVCMYVCIYVYVMSPV